jgi:transketolase
MALKGIIDRQDHRVFNVMSDGECDEGSNWEAILFAPHHKLKNLVTIVDYNKLQSLFSPSVTLNLEPFTTKWEAFGWEVREVDGHDHEQLLEALKPRDDAKKPLCIIAHTTKGKGVSFMENNNLWHYRTAQGQEYLDAKKELEEGSI